ncbi:hypothetical protein LPN04_29215 [Rugamonas sp. A1-17]|nr:hypothetical protein [Rugamonas sp. A1-17]
MKNLLPLILLAASLPALAQETKTPPQLVRLALADGRASGTVGGAVADETRRRLNATGALQLVVQRVYLFQQPDCGRVQLDFTQDAALLPGTAIPAAYTWSTQMNICADGYPPSKLTRRTK